MMHKTFVDRPVWCKWCKCTTERSVMLHGDNTGPTLNHETCGRIMSELQIKELHDMTSISRIAVIDELVRKANMNREPQEPVENALDAFRIASFGKE